MSTPTRFSDGQYKNWLKCSQSLIIMKEALHDYTDNEVRKLHGDITQKVSSIPCASSTSNQCSLCSSKDIRMTGNPRKWSINCKNNICDKWLQQILAVHEIPHYNKINWKNADIRLWPVDCYQVAKIFMPKGQDKTVKMPDDLDAPAILSLFKYCKCFRKDLPNQQILSDLIDFRNKVLHSGDLKVSDSDKDRKIDQMIQLLKDLKIHGAVISNLETLKKEDIDINFRETEIRLLEEMVSGLVNDINTVKKDMANMENSVSDLSENMEEVRDRTMETLRKVDALNTDMEGTRNSLEELRVIYDKMVSFLGKNPGILDSEITESIRIMGMDVKGVQSNLSRVQTELQVITSRVSSLEYRVEGIVEETKEKIEGIERRVAAVEEQNKHNEQFSLQTETTRNKRPESEGLRNLKNQTESILRTHRKQKYILTEQAKDAEKLLAEKRSIVIEGNPGEGKTTLSRHLIDNEKCKDKRVVLNKPSQWEKVDTDSVAIVVLEDVFGKYDFDPGRLQEWIVHLPTIQEHVDVGELQVIVTTRADVLSKAYCQRLGSLNLFSKELSLTLSSEQLTGLEKINILKRELDKHQRDMKEDDIKVCIANFGGLIGFPQCCSLFAGDSKSFDKGPDFFRSPKKFFVQNIEGLEPTRFLSLAFLFCNGKILEENLSSVTMPESSKKLLMELASSLCFSENQTAITLLRGAYETLGEMYVVKSVSYDFTLKPGVEKTSIMFTHATVSEAVADVLGKHCCEMVVKYGDSEYLYQRTYTAEVEDKTSENVFLPVSVYGLLAERMVHDVVYKSLVSSVVKHSALTRYDFIKKLKDELNKVNVLKDFFMARKYEFFMARTNEFGSDTLSEGKCFTFMQYILQDDEDVVRLVYSELLEMLTCAHNDNTPDCWRCEEKQNLLELALYYHHFEIADKLIVRNACYTDVSLCNAARHGDLKRVQTITEKLKKNKDFNPESKEAKYALYRAYVSGNQSLTDFLLMAGIVLDCCYVVNAVKLGDMNVLTNVVEHLKLYNKWNPKCDDASKALEIAICKHKYDVYDLLVQNGVSLKMKNLPGVIMGYASLEFKKAIQHIKDTDNWNPVCDDASKALEIAICQQMYDVYDLLVQNGVSLKMENLPGVICLVSLEYVKKVVQHIKESDNWNPECDDASKALQYAICQQKDDVYDLLSQERVSLKMKNLPGVIMEYASLESVKKAIQHIKDTDNWNPECDDASKALEIAIYRRKYDAYDLLSQERISLKMKNLPDVIMGYASLEYVKKVVQHMKESDNWNPVCDDASEALEIAICQQKDDVYDLLIQEKVSLKMKNLPGVIMEYASLESVKKAIQHIKDTDNWNPVCDDASKALEIAICQQMYDVYDLLFQEEVSLKMKNLQSIIIGVDEISLESVKKAIQHLKDTDIWDPKCDGASEALLFACNQDRYDVVDLLLQEGVLLNENFS
ncbi:hypothetical protein ACJMK2_012577 [Sinanodonta woodiana]|uniref:Novel STAND NTPase 3 domain-containing protein n=1 Tax=Sinanodonta woodiana TaxID=1069815 RepID=A0ABD3V8M7_SINWO